MLAVVCAVVGEGFQGLSKLAQPRELSFQDRLDTCQTLLVDRRRPRQANRVGETEGRVRERLAPAVIVQTKQKPLDSLLDAVILGGANRAIGRDRC